MIQNLNASRQTSWFKSQLSHQIEHSTFVENIMSAI